MARTFHLDVVTPGKSFYHGEVEMVVTRTINGDSAFMADHMWTVVPLSSGVLKIKEKGQIKKATCSGGYIHVKEGKTTIVADSAEWPDEIDINRAKEAKQRAEERLASENQEVDLERARAAMLRALNRINVYEEHFSK